MSSVAAFVLGLIIGDLFGFVMGVVLTGGDDHDGF